MAELSAFCWPLSAAPGEAIALRVSTTAAHFVARVVRFELRDPAEVDDAVVGRSEELRVVVVKELGAKPGKLQDQSLTSDVGCESWEVSLELTVEAEWTSGVYAVLCEDAQGMLHYAPFAVRPARGRRSTLLGLLNANTWNAYNPELGFSRYFNSDDAAVSLKLSFLRNNGGILCPGRKDSDYTGNWQAFGFTSRHQLRGELWVLGWLAREGYAVDVCTDLDFHRGVEGLHEYSALVLSTHPEYWTEEMYKHLRRYLEGGGSLLYLGGNGVFDSVTYDAECKVMTVYGGVFRRTRLLRHLGLEESALLGVATPVAPGVQQQGDVDALQADGNNFGQCCAYKVDEAGHWLLDGTGLAPGQTFGGTGWYLPTGFGPDTIATSGASGGECDLVFESTAPLGTLRLASGLNTLAPMPDRLERKDATVHAELAAYEHRAGGFVLSAGSITFGGSLVRDPALQRIVRNALAEAKRRRR